VRAPCAYARTESARTKYKGVLQHMKIIVLARARGKYLPDCAHGLSGSTCWEEFDGLMGGILSILVNVRMIYYCSYSNELGLCRGFNESKMSGSTQGGAVFMWWKFDCSKESQSANLGLFQVTDVLWPYFTFRQCVKVIFVFWLDCVSPKYKP